MKSNILVMPAGPFAGLEAAFKRIVAGIHWLKIAHAESRRRARARAELAALDEHALRDLGLERSELDSYLAESLHHAESTRRRTAG